MLCSRPFIKQVTDSEVKVPFPCGKCFHCRINQGRIWQTRLLLEAYTAADSTFLTLTYDDDHLPGNGSLDKKHLTNFLKRYRKRFEPGKIRYYAVGEYGDQTWRPHYHLAIFSDRRIERCYRSCEDMRKRNLCTQDCYARLAWPYGNVSVTPTLGKENAGYITGYLKKKATKPYYENLGDRIPEYATMSRGRRSNGTGGIGYEGICKIAEKFKSIKGPDRGNVIRSLNFGTSSRPLGGYLTAELCNQLGISESIRKAEFVLYSNGTFLEHRDKDGEILVNLLEKSAPKRHAQKVKSQIFKRRKQL